MLINKSISFSLSGCERLIQNFYAFCPLVG
jgi:hypothetical protein